MDFIPFPNVAEAELRYTWKGQRVENTLYFENNDPPTIEDLNNLGTILGGWWNDSIAPQQTDEVTLNEIYITDLTSDVSPTVTYTSGLPANGGNAAAGVTNSITLAVSFRTTSRGRSARGRNYFVGLLAPLVVDNAVQADYAESIRSAYEDLLDAVSESVWTWVVASRFHNGLPRVTGQTRIVQSVVLTDLVVDNQRRRLPGRGA